MNKVKWCGIVGLIGYLLRQFVLPNPFECFGDKAWLINIIAEPIIHAIAFGLVGLFYQSGSDPTWGSVLYTIVYAVINAVLMLLSIFKFAWWWILIVVLAAFFICAIMLIKNNNSFFK